jgi:hypothetical protein
MHLGVIGELTISKDLLLSKIDYPSIWEVWGIWGHGNYSPQHNYLKQNQQNLLKNLYAPI